METDLTEVIETRSGARSGKSFFVGARIAVYDVLEYLASGMSTVDTVRDFPELTADTADLVVLQIPDETW